MNNLPKKFKLNDTLYKINKLSVLQNFKKEDLNDKPFPYLVIKDCLPNEIYEHLENTYPSDEHIFEYDKNNHKKMYHNTRYQINSSVALEIKDATILDPIWELFIRYHTSKIFFNEVKSILGERLENCDVIKNKLSYYKNFNEDNVDNINSKLDIIKKCIKKKIYTLELYEKKTDIKEEKKEIIINKLSEDIKKHQLTQNILNIKKKNIAKINSINNLSLGIRNIDNSDIQLDCQIGINSPCRCKSVVKGPHIDNLSEIYAGLFYMKQNIDNGTGGDLLMYDTQKSYINQDEFIKNNPFIKINKIIDGKPFVEHRGFDDKKIKLVNTINYDRNTFVLFLSTINSIHSVSPRSKNKVSRRLVNIIGESYTKTNNDRYK